MCLNMGGFSPSFVLFGKTDNRGRPKEILRGDCVEVTLLIHIPQKTHITAFAPQGSLSPSFFPPKCPKYDVNTPVLSELYVYSDSSML